MKTKPKIVFTTHCHVYVRDLFIVIDPNGYNLQKKKKEKIELPEKHRNILLF